MKTTYFTLLTITTLFIYACHTSKKSSSTSTASTVPVVPATPPTPTLSTGPVSGPAVTAKSANGVYAPGNEELSAIKTSYPDLTLETLTAGHGIYIGACANCHDAKSIYKISEESWPGILNNMAPMAQLSATQKDAVYKYVLSIKATQPK